MTDTLEPKEPHPAALAARDWIAKNCSTEDLLMWLHSFSSCAIDGNRLAEVCAGTIRRLIKGEPVSDRYMLGLAWTIMEGTNDRNS